MRLPKPLIVLLFEHADELRLATAFDDDTLVRHT